MAEYSDQTLREEYQKHRQFYDDLYELQQLVDEYRDKCAEQEKKARYLLTLQQQLSIRTDWLEKHEDVFK